MGKIALFGSIILILAGAGLIVSTIIISGNILDNNRSKGADYARITVNNSDTWGAVPGNREYDIKHFIYVYDEQQTKNGISYEV